MMVMPTTTHHSFMELRNEREVPDLLIGGDAVL